MNRSWPAALLAVCAVFGLGAAAWSAYVQDWTTDEPIHLEWSRRLLDDGVGERTSSLHFNSKTPVVMANVAARRFARRGLGVRDPDLLRLAARLPTVLFMAGLLAAVFVFARRLLGTEAACLAAALTAVDPSVIAHGSLATVDVAFALATVLVLAAGLRFWQRAGLVAGALLGLALAFALLVKFTALLLLPALVLVAAVRPWRPGPPPPSRALWLGAAAGACAGLFALCAGYLFHGVGAPLSAFEWRTPLLARLARAAPGLRLPVPLEFLTGIDVSFSAERTKEWPVAILGQPRRGRLAYYFVLLWAVKTALAAAAAQVAGAALLWRSRVLRGQPALRALAAVLLALLAYLSFLFKAKLGYRHALMLVPLACILCAAGLASRARGRRAALVAALVAALAMAEQVPYLGNHLAFSNALVWPKREAYRVMADSNLDWGQNDDKMLAWMAASARPLTRLNPPHLSPGENIVSASVFVFGNHGWARRHLRPRFHFRHTYLIFDVTEADFARLLEEERRLPPSAAEGCASAALAPLPPTQRLALAGTARLRLLCLRAPAGADLAVTASAGRALVGPWGRPMREWDPVGPGQSAWFRLPPGPHALALSAARGFQAEAVARGGTVELAVVER